MREVFLLRIQAPAGILLADRAASLIESHAGGCLVGPQLGPGPLPRSSSHPLGVIECLLAWQEGGFAGRKVHAPASRQEHTAGISLLTHLCISVALNIIVHPKLTYGHQSQYHQGLHTLCKPSWSDLQTLARFKFSARHGISSWKKADAVSSLSQNH